MMNRKLTTALQIVLVVGSVVMLYAGVLSGLGGGWFAMGFFFSITLVTVDSHVCVVLNLKIDKCFERLGGIISGKSGPILLGNRLRLGAVDVFAIISIPVMLSLSIFAGLRQHWLMVCVFLAATIVISVITSGVMLAHKIQAYSEHLEELICRDREDGTSQEVCAE